MTRGVCADVRWPGREPGTIPAEETQRRAANMRVALSSPAVRAKIGDRVRASWADPAIRAQRAASRSAFEAKRREAAPHPVGTALYRQTWIAEQAASPTGVNRKILMREFGIHRSTARDDINRYKAKHPGALIYDASAKVHRAQVPA